MKTKGSVGTKYLQLKLKPCVHTHMLPEEEDERAVVFICLICVKDKCLGCIPKRRSREMEKVSGLGHLFVTIFLYSFSTFMVIPAITDVTMSAICPGEEECSLAIYLSAVQQAVCMLSLMYTHTSSSPSSFFL